VCVCPARGAFSLSLRRRVSSTGRPRDVSRPRGRTRVAVYLAGRATPPQSNAYRALDANLRTIAIIFRGNGKKPAVNGGAYNKRRYLCTGVFPRFGSADSLLKHRFSERCTHTRNESVCVRARVCVCLCSSNACLNFRSRHRKVPLSLLGCFVEFPFHLALFHRTYASEFLLYVQSQIIKDQRRL